MKLLPLVMLLGCGSIVGKNTVTVVSPEGWCFNTDPGKEEQVRILYREGQVLCRRNIPYYSECLKDLGFSPCDLKRYIID